MSEHRSIAIDGPSGAGKSTIARMIAEAMGCLYVDTGAIYRTVGLYARNNGVNSKDEAGVTALLPGIEIELEHVGGAQRMFLNGADVSEDIRLPEISIYASDVSAMPAVRSFLLDMQRELARRHDVIMDGRDIGTVVLPDADVKIYLTASAGVRAERRHRELIEKGVETAYEDVLRDIEYRDLNDSTRAAAPLRPADDAVTVDTTNMDLRESFENICCIVRERWV